MKDWRWQTGQRVKQLLPLGAVQFLDGLFLGQTCQAFGRCLKVQPQGPLDADFAVAESGRVEDLENSS